MFKGDQFFDLYQTPPIITDYYRKPDYFKFEKGIEVQLLHMSPENYIRTCAEAHKGSFEREMGMINFDRAMYYANMMMKGSKFPTPYIDYLDNNQEGRHRAYAVEILINTKHIEPTKIPVYIIKKSNYSKEDYQKYMVNKVGEQFYNTYFR